jgi:hypothetical protein
MRVLMSPPQNFSKYNFSFSVKELTASVGIWVIAASENRATFLVEDVILVESASLKFHFRVKTDFESEYTTSPGFVSSEGPPPSGLKGSLPDEKRRVISP